MSDFIIYYFIFEFIICVYTYTYLYIPIYLYIYTYIFLLLKNKIINNKITIFSISYMLVLECNYITLLFFIIFLLFFAKNAYFQNKNEYLYIFSVYLYIFMNKHFLSSFTIFCHTFSALKNRNNKPSSFVFFLRSIFEARNERQNCCFCPFSSVLCSILNNIVVDFFYFLTSKRPYFS